MAFPIFSALLLILLAAANVRVHGHVAELLRLGAAGRRRLGVTMGAVLASTFLVRVLERRLPEGVVRVAGTLVLDIELAILVAGLLLLVIDGAAAGIRLLARASRRPRTPVAAPVTAPDAPIAAPTSRRVFLRTAAGSALAVGGATSVYGAVIGRHGYRIEELVVPLVGLPRQLDGFTLVQLSDLHIGPYVADPELRAAVELTARARPDLVVLTGDLVDHDVRYAERLGGFVRRASELARHGVAVIPGNHDWYTGVDAVLTTAARAGAVVLRNRGLTVGDASGGFALLGVEDVYAEHLHGGARPDLERAIADVSPDLPRVLLCHNPTFFPVAAPRVSLQLSGHTHGGQFGVGPINPVALVLQHPFIAGSYRIGASKLYVNRGFGTAGPPARLGSAPEVTRVVLVSA